MSSKPLVVRYDIQGVPFAVQFLAADDFEVSSLKAICKDLGINHSGAKNLLIGYIERHLTSDSTQDSTQIILHNLIRRSKKWFTFKHGKITTYPSLSDPADLVYSEGKSEWYGPIVLPEVANEKWYIKPIFIPHWEIDVTSKEPILHAIRWFVYAKMVNNFTSFHWQGFTHSADEDSTERESQFPYWDYIPKLIDEFEKLASVQLEYPNLHQFVLHQLWAYYRIQNDYTWTDLRIRAESGGVSLNARSAGVGGDAEIDVKGINHLAHTLSLSVIRELELNLDVTRQKQLQEGILQTIIREFGAKSYEFSLEHGPEKLLKAHIYFGMKPNFPSPDAFPHVNCYIKWKNDQDQLAFIIGQINSLPKNVNSKPIQPSLI